MKAVPKNKLGWTHMISFEAEFTRYRSGEDGSSYKDHVYANTNDVMVTVSEDGVQRRFRHLREVRERFADGRSEVECTSTLKWSKGVFQIEATGRFYRWTSEAAADGKTFTFSPERTLGEPQSWKKTHSIDELMAVFDRRGCGSRAEE